MAAGGLEPGVYTNQHTARIISGDHAALLSRINYISIRSHRGLFRFMTAFPSCCQFQPQPIASRQLKRIALLLHLFPVILQFLFRKLKYLVILMRVFNN